MDPAYNTAEWHDLYVFAGGAAAVLMGLVFVALSLHLGPITQNPDWRGRARGAVFILMAILLTAILILIPGQSAPLLGAELLAMGLLGFASTLRSQLRTVRQMGLARTMIVTYGLALLAPLFLALSGGSLIWGRFGGLYLLAVGIGLLFVFAALASWQLMVAVGDEMRSGAARR